MPFHRMNWTDVYRLFCKGLWKNPVVYLETQGIDCGNLRAWFGVMEKLFPLLMTALPLTFDQQTTLPTLISEAQDILWNRFEHASKSPKLHEVIYDISCF